MLPTWHTPSQQPIISAPTGDEHDDISEPHGNV
jgi:hypothetical protein